MTDAIDFLETHLIERQPWYQALVDDCKDIIVEGEFSWRMTILETYHSLGKRILEENQNFQRSQIYGDQIVQRIAESLNRSERTLYYAIKFAETFPAIDEVPEGKNISWRLVCQKYLTKPKEEKQIPEPKGVEEYLVCKSCGSENIGLTYVCKHCRTVFEFKSENIRRR